MGGELILTYYIEDPVTDLTRYNELINGIKSLECFAIVEKPITAWKNTPIETILDGMRSNPKISSTISDQDDDYAFGIDLNHLSNKPPDDFILFPNNPNKHCVLNRMHWRSTDSRSAGPLEIELKKLCKAFPKTFELLSDDGSEKYDFDYYDHNRSPSPDYTACSSHDCGYCGKCDY